MAPLRISAISFLNTAPLMWDFEQGECARKLAQHFDLSYTVPSKCAEQLKAGSADIGIIPVAAYTTIPDLVVVPGVSIAAKSAVRSILLVSKVPVEKIRNVATDDSSRTSSALVEVFLRKFVGIAPGFTRQPPNLEEMLRWHDAALLIGDPALQANTDGYHVYDLAEQWQRWTGRPFVFAFWAVRKAGLAEPRPEINIARVLQQSRDHGLQHIPEIVSAWAPRLGLSEKLVADYLAENVDYSLDQANLEGLHLFFRYAEECQVLPAAPEIQFLDAPAGNVVTG
ncbi:MAG TPA: menaquinone biosynthesis protein [Candidatus Angelobacter sp.]|nr:menaquinone biosynthesis protein [Candidatus Angelobacter sp.]